MSLNALILGATSRISKTLFVFARENIVENFRIFKITLPPIGAKLN